MKLINKRISLTLFALFCAISANAQRYSDERFYDIVGLPEGDEVADALVTGIPVMLIGFLIAYIFMWSDPENVSDLEGKIGCFGVLVIGIGFFLLLPLWIWVEAIVSLVLSIGFYIAIVVLIIYFIWYIFKSKSK